MPQPEEETKMPQPIHHAALAAGLAAVLLAPGQALAVQESAFEARTTAQLTELCATPRTDPAYPQAMQFCHGFAAGALSYHRAAQRPGSGPAFCNLPATRQEAVDRFVAWTRANPQFATANPANSLFRFLDANYPCAGRTR
jgi:hypothetical protein